MRNHSRWRASGPSVRMGAGFSLIELMTAIAVAAILMAIAVPSFTALINGSRLTSQANELVASLQYARSEAIRLNRKVTLCPSSDGASCSDAAGWGRWIVRMDAAAASDPSLRDVQTSGKTTISADVDKVSFSSDGLARSSDGLLAAATITVCMDTTRPAENQRVVTLASGARVSVAQATGDCQ
jgi:type IV fimbrial biogenesis protein FimT